MKKSTRASLSALMFFQYFVWGAWYVTMGTYLLQSLKTDAVQVGSAYANLSLAAIVSPFVMGLLSDRFFPAQKVLGVLHLLGAAILLFISQAQDFTGFWWLLLLYTLLYTPTISLANSVSFSGMKDPGKEFPSIRVLGTVGWIAAGLLVGFLEMEHTAAPFQIAAAASFVLGLFCFSLPNTPPVKKKVALSSILGLDALGLFQDRSFAVFFVSSILICIPLAFYYSFANPFLNDMAVENAAGKMTLGQLSEVVFMLIIPLLFRRLGVKKMLLVGMGAWVLRYVLFSLGDGGAHLWMLITGILLHGICYDFFFVTGQIYTEQKAGQDHKSAAQGLITFATYGAGMLIGSYVSGYVTEQYASGTHYQWPLIWLVPAAIALGVIVLFSLLYRENKAPVLSRKEQEREPELEDKILKT